MLFVVRYIREQYPQRLQLVLRQFCGADHKRQNGCHGESQP